MSGVVLNRGGSRGRRQSRDPANPAKWCRRSGRRPPVACALPLPWSMSLYMLHRYPADPVSWACSTRQNVDATNAGCAIHVGIANLGLARHLTGASHRPGAAHRSRAPAGGPEAPTGSPLARQPPSVFTGSPTRQSPSRPPRATVPARRGHRSRSQPCA